ncbi:amidoligase family protein [Hominenteromicrobium sp.]|uniref:amidoligase family protein n=1 Tax=Hominenteromicrobium sp. TaxID=3073581 RepID=UPI003AB5DAA0
MAIGIQDQYFGTEIEMTGITRQRAAEKVAELFGTRAVCDGGYYGVWSVTDQEGKKWKFMYDGSIYTERRERGRMVRAGSEYSTEMVSPKLSYGEMGKLQEVVRCLRHHGAKVNASCGQHVHVDASNHTPRSLKNAMTIMYSKEDILFKALNVNESRVQRWCRKVREPMLEKIRKLPKNTTMDRLKQEWYGGADGSSEHYNWTRYHALNLHSVFYRGTLEWRCFESTLHAGKVRANITLALAISAQAINQSRTVMRKTEISENPAFTFRTFLLRLGLIGPEYKNVREHLLSNLPGDRAWRYDKAQYASLQDRRNQERQR